MIGSFITCKLTLWLYVAALKKSLPWTGKTKCKITDVLDDVGPGYTPMIVDCTKDIQWLDTDTPRIMLVLKEGDTCEN